MIDDLLPLLMWLFAVVWSLGVCAVCAVRGRLFDRARRRDVDPVSWNVVAAQAATVVFVGLPFVVYSVTRDEYGPVMRGFYERYLIAGVVISLLLVAAEWALMYVQAWRADRSMIDRLLKR